jgi:glycosyltransferase involved in cell wall biosynthesis
MKVLYLFNKIKTGTGEEERIASGNGHDSHLFGMLRLRKLGIVTHHLEVEQFLPRWACRLLRRRLNIFWIHSILFPLFFSYDVVFTSTAYGSLFFWAITKTVFRIRRPRWVILDFNIIGTIGARRTLRQKMFSWAVGHVDGIVAISEAEADALKERFPHLSSRILFLHEATDTVFFSPRPHIAEERSVLSVGRDPGRDWKTLIDACRTMDVPVKLATKREAVAPFMPLPPHIGVYHFNHDEMRDEYARAGVVVISLHLKDPASNDSMGTLSLTEAMAMGKAVIVTDTKSMHSYIEDGVNGIFVPQGDSAALKAAIERVLHDDALRSRLGKAARAFVLAHAGADLFAERLERFLKDAVLR